MNNHKKKRKRLLQATGHKCFYCGRKLKRKGARRKRATVDHFIPKAAGGLNNISNLRAACQECNHEKGQMMPERFLERFTLTEGE